MVASKLRDKMGLTRALAVSLKDDGDTFLKYNQLKLGYQHLW